MNRRTLLVLILSSIYLERKYTNDIKNIEYYIDVLNKSKPTNNETNMLEMGADPTEGLITIINNILDMKTELEDTEAFLQKVRLICSHDSYLFESVELMVRPTYTEDDIKRKIRQTHNTINDYLTDLMLKETSKIMYRLANGDNLSKDEKVSNIEEIINKLGNIQNKYGNLGTSNKHPALIGGVTISNDKECDIDILSHALEKVSPDAVFKPGWQCLQRMFGEYGGGLPGESLLVGAMEFNYKSSMCRNLLRWACIYNKPKLIDPKKKPLIYRMSLEDDYQKDIIQIYKEIYANEYGSLPDMATIDIDEANKYIFDRLQRNGWHVIIEQYDPNKLTYQTVIQILDNLQAQGYEIKMFNVDYIALIDKAGCTGGSTGDDIRLLYRKISNYCKANQIWYITPHQISSKAFELRRQGKEDDFLKDILGKGYWDGCQRLGQEPDMDLLTHVIKTANGSFLTMGTSRHRGVEQIPFEHAFAIRKWENGFIPDDINGPDLTRTRIGGGTVGGTEKSEDWDF